jgi:NAD(P)H-dependent glutamate synthase small subunit
MASISGFLNYKRENTLKRPVAERIRDFRELEQPQPEDGLKHQAARCMDCGVPHCHSMGCPLYNAIPEWNELVHQSRWREALAVMDTTNNFPEFTGRLCPAPCEDACTLTLDDSPVAIRQIEWTIAEQGWRNGWIEARPAAVRSGHRVAIVGSGPAGLAAAQQLVRRGHDVVVFERSDRAGGLLRYGIPDFKLEKHIVDRRLSQMKSEGVVFETGVEAGRDISLKYLRRQFNAVVLAIGSTIPRPLSCEGASLEGVHTAMAFLTQQNRRLAGDPIPAHQEIDARGKDVVVIGGGDTGSDCVGTAIRQGARSVRQIEILPRPVSSMPGTDTWPYRARILRTSSSQEEGCDRNWSVQTRRLEGENGHVRAVEAVEIEWSDPDSRGRQTLKERAGSERTFPADLVLLAMGFLHPDPGVLLSDASIECVKNGTLRVDTAMKTTLPDVFAAGDCVMGASLVVHAIAQGRRVAESVERYLYKSN